MLPPRLIQPLMGHPVASCRALLLGVVLAVGLQVAVSAQSAVCGDCDSNGVRNILDALRAAQIHVGTFQPSPLERINCDVVAHGSVTILDALLLAQRAAGLPVTLDCPNSLRSGALPEILHFATRGVTSPGTVAAGDVTLEVQIADAESDPVDILVELQTPGRSYELATLAGPGMVWRNLSTSPAGILHTVTWRTRLDLPEAVGRVRLRVTAYDPGAAIARELEVLVNNLAARSASGQEWVQPSIGSMGAIPPPLTSQDHRANLLLDGRIAITGGSNASSPFPLSRTLVYDPIRHEVVQASNLPGGGRVGHVTAVIDRPASPHFGWLACAGGYSDPSYYNDLQVMNPQTLQWTLLPILLTSSSGSATFHGFEAVGKGDPSPAAYVNANSTLTTGPLVLYTTIFPGPPEPLQTNLAYRVTLDPDDDGNYLDSSVALVYLSYIREIDEDCTVTHHPGFDAVLGTPDDRLLIFGGVGIRVDPVTGALIRPVNNPPGEPRPLGCVLADAEIIDLGSGATDVCASTEFYDTYEYVSQAVSTSPPGGDWDDPSLVHRYNHDAVLLEDGGVLIAGGVNIWGDVSDPSLGEVPISPSYDLAVQVGALEPLFARSFILRPDPLQPQLLWNWRVEIAPHPLGTLANPGGSLFAGLVNYAEAVRIPAGLGIGGSVLLAGGDDLRTAGSASSGFFQVYDPAAATWTLINDPGGSVKVMLQPRALHSLTALPGGAVVAIGGSPGAGVASAVPSFEIYLP